LRIDFKAGFFYFEITDRTDVKYTFDERSSGLKYFLSYYIQALALERTNPDRGSIILMDEPDGFLSAAGQRNLLTVFEELVDARRSSGRCQLVYTTHSPFLINKNFPGRIRLIRKGDGREGSQFVDQAAFRRFEPIRTALGVDYAETLFLGAENVVVEGPADQKLLTGCIQRFGDPARADALLDLNKAIFIAAGGTSRVKPLIRRSIGGGDDKRPVAVALLDGDAPGSQAAQEIIGENLLRKEYVICLDQLQIENAHVHVPRVLEDLVPAKMLTVGVVRYFRERWDVSLDPATIEKVLGDAANGSDTALRLKAIWSQFKPASVQDVDQVEFRAGVIDTVVELLLDSNEFAQQSLDVLLRNITKVCNELRKSLDRAVLDQSRELAHKRIRYHVSEFGKTFTKVASKADVKKYLEFLHLECEGLDPSLKQAKDNIELLQTELEKTALQSDTEVDLPRWHAAFDTIAASPWSKTFASTRASGVVSGSPVTVTLGAGITGGGVSNVPGASSST
jgi:hypothetical protein